GTMRMPLSAVRVHTSRIAHMRPRETHECRSSHKSGAKAVSARRMSVRLVRDLKHHSATTSATSFPAVISGSVQISRLVHDQRSIRIRSSRASGKVVQHSHLPSLLSVRQLENRAASKAAVTVAKSAAVRGAEQVPLP